MFHNNSRRDLDHLWRAANTALHPALLLELTLAREKRFLSSTDGKYLSTDRHFDRWPLTKICQALRIEGLITCPYSFVPD
ncbi:hypothetical protein DPMN_067566 [Dreissena polymorpha]|uniref:Uncharacterized protein n=1 Tax=Dreissena polymorpha TaxID=45954 RepID=A0A9D3YXI8_DREPO|nr:hypothetical protein DPMN_067566 [Dreissena polymorpha]